MLKPKIAGFIAYWGPAFSGKAMTLDHLYEAVPPELRHAAPAMSAVEKDGELYTTTYVDLTPPWLADVAGRRLTFRVATEPGQVFYDVGRDELMDHADSFVLVLDARCERFEASIEAALNLAEGLDKRGRSLADLCLAVQLSVFRGPDNVGVREVAGAFAETLPWLAGRRLFPADPDTGEGCELAFKRVTTDKYEAIKGMVGHGIIVPA